MGVPGKIPLCRRCQRKITSPFIQALGAAWHPGCWRCEACGKPLETSFVERDGRAFHPVCYDARFGLKCGICGNVIRGTYFQVDGKAVCEQDYRTQVGPRCAVCGQALVGPFVTNELGQKACERHREGKKCFSCTRWLNEGERAAGLFAEYGAPLCGQCSSGKIGPGDLVRYGNAFGALALAEVGIQLRLPIVVPIRLDSVGHIRTLQSPIQAQAEGLTRTTAQSVDGRVVSRIIQEILVVGGLALEHFEGVLAHEFGHVWLYQQGLDPIPDPVAEGFCELVRYLVLARVDTRLAGELRARLAGNRDPIYGDGFRRFKSAWDQSGTQGVVNLLMRR